MIGKCKTAVFIGQDIGKVN